MNRAGIRIVVVEDSLVAREMLVELLNTDPEITVVGQACDGLEAVETVRSLRPDVVTMDVHLPRMNGYEATRRIMKECPVPVVIVTADWNPDDSSRTFRILETGAVDIIEKPSRMGRPGFHSKARHLVDTVKAMARVDVVTHREGFLKGAGALNLASPAVTSVEPGDIRIVAFGVSTGGPMVLRSILSRLPRDYPVPIVIALHIVSGFAATFARWLDEEIRPSVVIAEQDLELRPGHVYVAPGGHDIVVTRFGKLSIEQNTTPGSACPSVAALFASVADNYGSKAAGLLLTGMGKDGAQELGIMRERGAVTFAQNEESSTVHGMPGEAIRIGAAQFVQSPDEMADSLLAFAIKSGASTI